VSRPRFFRRGFRSRARARAGRAAGVFAVLGLGFAVSAGPMAAAPDPGAVFRKTTLELAGGDEVSFDALRGHVVVVNFWASWCKPCRKELPVLQQWRDELAGRGVAFVTVSVDEDPRKADRFLEHQGLSLPVVHDGPEGLAKKLDLPHLPCTYVLDPKGQVVFTSRGSDDAALDEVHATVRALLDAAPMRASMDGVGKADGP
jgi:thiol-disulfide isomerase/thioredoxin